MIPETDPKDNGSLIAEGKVTQVIVPSGGEKGPGSRNGIFFNPAMVENRDMSILMMQMFVDSDMLPGKSGISVLDGLTGTGIRALRFEREIEWGNRTHRIVGNDKDRRAVLKALENVRLNGLEVEFINEDLSAHLTKNRYSYIDVDPFGSPVPFLDQTVRSVLSGGIIAVTATDTAALTGSIPRVSRRRYGVTMKKTHYMHEASCRALMGYIARLGAAHEIGTEPLYFYSSDHFLRGYIRLRRGAKRSDSSLKKIGYLIERPPNKPIQIRSLSDVHEGNESGDVLGPLWLGSLSDPDLMKNLNRYIDINDEGLNHIRSLKIIRRRVGRALEEWNLPPGGFDIDALSSEWKIQQPTADSIVNDLRESGYQASRSRFSDKLIRTDASIETMHGIMTKIR